MSPYILAIFLMSLGLGTTITFASSHWLLAWMGLEINTLAIIPLMARHHHPRATEAATKYFLTQATAAATLLFATISNAWLTGQWEIQQLNHNISITIFTIAMALKIGLAPVHSWLPEVLQGLDLNTGLILSTWQKLAPLALLYQVDMTNSKILTLFAITSALVGGWGGLNQTQLRKILAYSSISHLGWMILILQFYPSLTMMTLWIYIAMTSSTFLIFKLSKATNINSLAMSWAKSPILAAITPLVLLSLGGLPPLTGFLPKWFILHELTKQNLLLLALLMAFTALLSLFFYVRLAYAMTLTSFPNTTTGVTPWRFPSNQHSLPIAMLIMVSISLLPIAPTLMTLFHS
uniref:NADH-ubiquinone oxidoreductase chain 2 n=1 Tax=Rachycentron canadum TaxID=141264 RepID=B5U132_RACCA|nr:NADH dehydrogenase subunit 2 [Rachycentron canadum]ACH78269.1 NADH dehydrogenase subunit 2 [Rachycentron canadum]ACQ99747.1 NADH dehydrogenase subunit 2 [Rachycentron canadum]BAN83114.1 NADH dehydrogenase subunit 2 [Rachycentron canadum]